MNSSEPDINQIESYFLLKIAYNCVMKKRSSSKIISSRVRYQKLISSLVVYFTPQVIAKQARYIIYCQ